MPNSGDNNGSFIGKGDISLECYLPYCLHCLQKKRYTILSFDLQRNIYVKIFPFLFLVLFLFEVTFAMRQNKKF